MNGIIAFLLLLIVIFLPYPVVLRHGIITIIQYMDVVIYIFVYIYKYQYIKIHTHAHASTHLLVCVSCFCIYSYDLKILDLSSLVQPFFKKPTFRFRPLMEDHFQGCADGGMGSVAPPSIFKFARKLVKSQPCCKRVGHSNFCDLFLVTIVGQFVKMPPPQRKVSRHITGDFVDTRIYFVPYQVRPQRRPHQTM